MVGVQTCTVTLEINVVFPRKIGNQPTSKPSNTTFGHIVPTSLLECTLIQQGNLLNYVHSSIICNSKNLETTLMPLSQRINKENVAHLHNEVLISNKNNDILKFVGKS